MQTLFTLVNLIIYLNQKEENLAIAFFYKNRNFNNLYSFLILSINKGFH